MSEFVDLLFDHYTQNLGAAGSGKSQEALEQYQKLRELAGEDDAIDIWDAAVGEGAELEEVCFRAGLKAGVSLMLDLFSL